MINILKYSYYALFSVTIFTFSSIIFFIPIFLFSVTKLLIAFKKIRYLCTLSIEFLVSLWINFAISMTKLFSPTKFEFEQNFKIDNKASYLIICNHRSWLDTFILLMIFHRKISFPKFFMKSQVLFIPILGLIAWALEFPVMKRYSNKYLKKNPEKKVENLQKTVEYCKYLSLKKQITIVNFVEGTRFKSNKLSESNYKNLLNPKAGGIAIILENLSNKIVGVLNTIIIYDNSKQNLWNFMITKTRKIKVKIELIPISEIPINDYFNNDKDKQNFQFWLNKIWHNNDKYISKHYEDKK